jgi:hypothetical protein
MSEPYTWGPDESLSDVLTALGYKHTWSNATAKGLHVVSRSGVEAFASTRTDAYELCVLWLVRTRQVKLTPQLALVVDEYRQCLGAEVDAALAAAREV